MRRFKSSMATSFLVAALLSFQQASVQAYSMQPRQLEETYPIDDDLDASLFGHEDDAQVFYGGGALYAEQIPVVHIMFADRVSLSLLLHL